MNRWQLASWSWLLLAIGPNQIQADGIRRGDPGRPNIVIIFVDDLGYGDIRPFGDPLYATPNLDRMAREGRAFSDFSVSSAVCSSSRAALMTGCYHVRVGIHGALGPNSKIGLSPDETTVAEVCKSRGYATSCIGKWHLGDAKEFLPLRQGFDEYYGLPYSNDMWPLHPDLVKLPDEAAKRKSSYPPLPLFQDDIILDDQVTAEDQMRLTSDYTQRAVQFIEQKRDQPFFLYLAHSMVHVPLFASSGFLEKSNVGLFGDVMTEVDWSVGQILNTLDRLGLSENTLVLFTSDNGPWLSYGNHAGTAGGLREGKGTSFEGGVRVPTLMRWPGRIPSNTRCDEFAATIDVLPTVAALCGAGLPQKPIDGLDIRSMMFSEIPSESPHESFFVFYSGGQLQAVRDRQFKLLLPHKYNSLAGQPGGKEGSPAAYQQSECPLSLFDLKADPQERHDLSGVKPDIVSRLLIVADRARRQFGDKLANINGTDCREPGRIQ